MSTHRTHELGQFVLPADASSLRDGTDSSTIEQELNLLTFQPPPIARSFAFLQVRDGIDDQPQAQTDELVEARSELNRLAQDNIHSNRDLKRIREYMTQFEGRGLSGSEMASTYREVSRLIATNPVTTNISYEDRLKIAQQIMKNAARPGNVDQGRHDTCNVTVVEARMYTRNPSKAAKLVVDVATTGSFTTKDGTTITLAADSLKPDEEARGTTPANGQRSFASQIFQITAVNVHWQRSNSDPFGNYADKGSIKYEQIPSKRNLFGKDHGERLLHYLPGQLQPKELAKGPTLGAPHLKEIANQISGLNESDFVLENKLKGGANTVKVGSEQELKEAIKKAKDSNSLPVIIRVHTGNEPFLSDRGGSFARSQGVWHVVTITAYDEAAGVVSIDNQWGTGSDHKKVKVSQLYKATEPPADLNWMRMHEYTKDLFKQLPIPPIRFE